MRRRWIHGLLVALLILGLPVASPRQVAADQTQTPAKAVALTQLTYPSQVRAGESVPFQVEMATADSSGACCGRLSVLGPRNQNLEVDLIRTGPSTLAGTLHLSPHAQPGTWKVLHLTLRSLNRDTDTLLDRITLDRSFTVTESDQPTDTEAPSLIALELPVRAVVGEPLEIKVKAADNLSGLSYGLAWFESGDGLRPQTGMVTLMPTGIPGELSGRVLMDLPDKDGSSLRVKEITVYDAAGNATRSPAKALAGVWSTVSAKWREAPDALNTSPYLNLVHPGRLAYQHWLELDYSYLVTLLHRLPGEEAAVHEHLLAELSQLRAALDQVRAEIYTHPETGLRVVPFATTGKWMVLDKAIEQRLTLLSMTAPGRKTLTRAEAELAEQALDRDYRVVFGGDKLLPVDGGTQGLYGQVAAAYLHVLTSVPEVVAVLQRPADQSLPETRLDEFDPDLIYFTPVDTAQPLGRLPGRAMLRIPARTSSTFARNISDLFYQVGLHFGEAFFSAADDPQRDGWWEPYITLRNGHGWIEGVTGETPATNLAVDFAQTYLPDGVEFSPFTSYAPLRNNPAMAEAFRQMVGQRLVEPRLPLSISAQGMTQVGLSDRFQLSVTGPEVDTVMVYVGKQGQTPYVNQPVPRQFQGRSYDFTADAADMGDVHWYILRATGSDWRDQFRFYSYVPAPFLLDPVPAGTNQATVRISGATYPNLTVFAGERSVQADGEGRFALEVPLEPGENLIRLSLSEQELGARLRVVYEPEGTPTPKMVDFPFGVQDSIAEGVIVTTPYAIVQSGSLSWQAGRTGFVLVTLPVEPGKNQVTFLITDRYGNQSTWESPVISE